MSLNLNKVLFGVILVKYFFLLGFFVVIGGCKKTPDNSGPVKGGVGVIVSKNLPSTVSYDVVIYGGTSAGVIAAVQASRLGKKVALIANTSWLGGMTAGGLSNTDIGNYKVIGGITLEFYNKVASLYGKTAPQWKFEPKMAQEAINGMINSAHVTLFLNERLLLNGGVSKINSTITSITLESGKIVNGKMFIDASYEGDLMAVAGVSYTVGREANSEYGETLNGLTKQTPENHLDPYVIAGNPSSGLLPRVNLYSNTQTGVADSGIMSYNYRLTLTTNKADMAPVLKPAGYNPLDYELLVRSLQIDSTQSVSSIAALPNNKFDFNANGPFSSDYLGMSHSYVNADYTTRAVIANEHHVYDQGFLWTLQNDPRIPATVQKYYQQFGLAADEFYDNNNWPTQLYIREGRRMIGSYITTQQDIENQTTISNPIGMGSYGIDCHPVELLVNPGGKLYYEGGVYATISSPFPISYLSIVPTRAECTNLFVPVCLSCTHVALSSIRMEPQYMILGQSAAIAACLCIDNNVAAQDLKYTTLQPYLTQEKQIVALN